MENKPYKQEVYSGQAPIGGIPKKSSRPYILVGIIGAAIIAGISFSIFLFLQNQGSPSEESILQASPPKLWRIGVLVDDADTFVELGAFQEKMEELGHKEGVDVEYVIKNAEDDDEVSKQHAKEFLADDSIDLVYSVAGSYRAFNKTSLSEGGLTKPTVFSNVGNFERMGLVGLYEANMNFGLNFTGVVCGNIEFAQKRMQILKDIVPDATVFGILVTPGTPEYERSLALNVEAAANLGIELKIIEQEGSEELLARAKEEFTKDTVDGVLRTAGNDLGSKARKELAAYFVDAGVPFMTWSHTNPVVPDYIAALANDPPTQARQAASMVHKIMNGVAIDDISIEFSENLEIHLNTAIAKKAGIKIPESVLLQAAIINTKL